MLYSLFYTNSLQVFFGLPLGLAPSTSYSIHFFTQSLSSFRNTCPYQHNLPCCSTKIMSFNPSHCLNFLLGTLSFILKPHIHLTILISAHWSATSFSFLVGQVSLSCNILLHTQLLYTIRQHKPQALQKHYKIASFNWSCSSAKYCYFRKNTFHLQNYYSSNWTLTDHPADANRSKQVGIW